MTRRRLIFGVMASVALCGVVALYVIGAQLSQPVPAALGPPPKSLDAQAVTFASDSGSTIHGWLSRGTAGQGSVLLLPGVRANRLSMVRRAEFLRKAGYSTLLIDFQATGESAGDAITFGWRERFDVLAAVAYLESQWPDAPIGIIGSSLGGAATLLATPPLRVRGAVLEAVYPDIEAAVGNRLRMRLGSIGTVLSPLLVWQMRPRLGVGADALRPIDHIAKLHCPVLIIAGAADRHTTPSDTAQLVSAAWDPKELWIIPAAAHVDFLEYAGDEYRRRILAFFDKAFARRP